MGELAVPAAIAVVDEVQMKICDRDSAFVCNRKQQMIPTPFPPPFSSGFEHILIISIIPSLLFLCNACSNLLNFAIPLPPFFLDFLSIHASVFM